MANIQKIESGTIRSIFNENDGKIYYSIVDSVGIVAKTTDARNYWKVLKNRLKKAQNQLVTECNQLKMPASDGKSYLTDVATPTTILKIIELISEEEIPYFRQYFDNIYYEMSKKVLLIEAEKIEPEKLILKKSQSYPQLENLKIKKEEIFSDNLEEFSLLVDAYLKNNFIVIKAFTAGVDMEQLAIKISPTSITISGSRSPVEQDAEREKNFSHQELFWGKFSRALEFPEEVIPQEAEQNEEAGMLTIKIPLAKKHTPKKILKMRTI